MNKTLSTTLTVLAVLALAAVIFFAGSMYARANTFGPSMMYGWNGNDNRYGPNP
jgi:dolichol kinase